jgi:aryl-alcohol dehydrogenase-like predicted oxidoreductase
MLVAVTDHAAERFRQRVRGTLEPKLEVAARVARAHAAGRTAPGERGTVLVRDLQNRELVYVCRPAADELVVITLWEEGEDAAVPRRFTDALEPRRPRGRRRARGAGPHPATRLLAMSEMNTRPLGDSGLEASIVGLGCNNFGPRVDLAGTRAVIDAAIEDGVTFLDTADIYGPSGASEELMGEALQGRHDDVVLATKFGKDMGDGNTLPRGSREYIHHAADASLRRLQTDVIDYYWMHEPDEATPIAETLGALQELIDAGKVRAIGASNFDGRQLREADAAARADGLTRFSAVQNHYRLLERGDAERDGLPACRELSIGFVPFFPLASGLLTGKYRAGEQAPTGSRLAGRGEPASEEQFALITALERYAEERGVTILDVAVGALLAEEPVVSVIAGATRPEQVHANAGAASWTPDQSDRSALRELLDAHSS